MHGRPPDRQLQVALEHGGVDLQPHATSSRTALGAMSAQPYTGTGVSSSNLHPNTDRLVVHSGGASLSAARHSRTCRRARLMCSAAHSLVGGRLFILGGSFFLMNSVHLKSLRDSTASPQYRKERKRIPASIHSCSFAVSSVNTFKWRFILFIKLIADILPFP